MDKDKDQIYCKHILDAIEGIKSFIAGLTFDEFCDDLKTQMAVSREIEIIGEASKRLSPELKNRLGNLPWSKITGMRDFLIHDYLDVDLDIVWEAATKDVDELKKALLE